MSHHRPFSLPQPVCGVKCSAPASGSGRPRSVTQCPVGVRACRRRSRSTARRSAGRSVPVNASEIVAGRRVAHRAPDAAERAARQTQGCGAPSSVDGTRTPGEKSVSTHRTLRRRLCHAVLGVCTGDLVGVRTTSTLEGGIPGRCQMAMNHAFHLTWRRGSPQTGAAARRRLPAAHVLPAARRDRDRSRLRFGAFCGLVGGSERGPHFFPSSPVDLDAHSGRGARRDVPAGGPHAGAARVSRLQA